MKLLPEETSLVIAGDWNPAILNPKWVGEHGLKLNADVNVEMLLPVVAGAALGNHPQYRLGGLSFICRPGQLVLAPTEGDKFELAEDAAANMVSILTHTPLRGVGHNFVFHDSDPQPAAVAAATAARADLVGAMDGFESIATSITANFRQTNDGGAEVLMSIERTFDEDGVQIRFNFHHPVTTVEQTLRVLQGTHGYQRMRGHLEAAGQLVARIYGEPRNDQT